MLVATAMATTLLAALPAIAQARWGRPFQFAAPGTLDVIAPQLAFSASGTAAAAFGLQDVDTPGTAGAYLTLRSANGSVGKAAAVAGARQILALGYDGASLELLTGASPSTDVCCSSAQAIAVAPNGRQALARTLVAGLAGPALGQLVTMADGQMLAAVATERGVWVVQSTKANRFGGQHLLTGGGQMPEALDAASLGGQSTIVTWTSAAGAAGAANPRTISYAIGSRTSAPRRVKAAVTVSGGHRIDELAVAPRGGSATLAWIESWYDGHGAYHSQVRAMDIGAHAAIRSVSAPSQLASGLTFGGDAAGDQALAWQSCTLEDSCTVQAAARPAGQSFGGVRTLGGVDPDEPPALAVGGNGQAFVAWISGGRPMASVRSGAQSAFSAPATLSSTTYAADITVGSGPRHSALAAWSQGTLNPSVVGAAYTG
jgi:hypothetical protein